MRALALDGHFEKKHMKALVQGYRIGKKRGLHAGILYGFSDARDMFLDSLLFYMEHS